MPEEETTKTDEKSLVAKYQKWYQEAEISSRGWREESLEDCNFYHGGKGQWKQKDVDLLEGEDRPVLSINRIKPTIDLQKGIEIRSRTDIDAKPKKEMHGQTAVAITAGFKYIQDQNMADQILSDVFFDGLKAGIGWVEICENDDPTEEEIQVRYASWKEVGYDPHARDFLLDDARYMYVRRWIDFDVAAVTWPSKKNELELAQREAKTPGTPYANKPESERYTEGKSQWFDLPKNRVLVVQIYFKKAEPTIFLKMKDGDVREVTQAQIKANPTVVADPSVIKVVRKPVDRVYTATFSGETILEPERRARYAHNRYSLIPFICYMDEDGAPYGMIRNMKDPQREINRNRSQYTHIIGTRRVFFETGALANPNQAKKEISRPDAWIELNQGALMHKRFQFQQDVAVAAEHFKIMQEAKQELQEVAGSPDENMGIETNARSGIAIEARQRQGATVNTEPFDNLRVTKHRLGEMMLSLMRQYWNYEKVIRITDDKTGTDLFFTFNQNGQNDITQGRYDIKVSEHPETETTRDWISQRLMDFATRMPPAIALPVLQTAFEMSDVPNKEKVLEKLKAAEQKQDQLDQQRMIIESEKAVKPPPTAGE